MVLIVAPATARDLVGRYVAAEGPDVAGRMELTRDGRFLYALSAGALDEQAQGRWIQRGAQACLTTAPTPKPPEFQPIAPTREQTSTVMVETRGGRGIPGVDLRIGFAVGEPLTGYTQAYGWTLPEDEKRVPLWIELAEPIHRFASPRFEIAADARGRFRAVLIPNDIGTVNFQGACLEAKGDHFVLHRREGDMRFRRVLR
jgi:hypothetical protein